MTDNPYSYDKVGYHFDRLSAMRLGLPVTPVHIHFIISDFCNQHCNFCAYRAPTGFSSDNFKERTGTTFNVNPMRQIPLVKAKEILRDCKDLGVRAIQFTGGGEPTAHPDHQEIIGYAQELGLQTALVTNGVVMRDIGIYENLEWLRVSLDAGTEETYEKTRQSKAWPRVWKNLEQFAKLKKPLVGVGFVVTKYNWREIYVACKQVRDIGISNVRISGLFSTEGVDHYGGQLEAIRDAIAYAKESLETDKFKIFNMFGDRVSDLELGKPDYTFCGYQQLTVYIGGDLKVYRCCTTSYTDHGEIGSLKEQTFRHWLLMEAQDKYLGFDAHSCHHCQFNEKNKRIIALTREKPLHVDFV